MNRIGVLGSTRGTALTTLMQAISQGQLHASVNVVVSNKVDAPILAKAIHYGLKQIWINPKGLSREEFDRQVSVVLNQHQVQLIVLIGYMRILSPWFIHQWRGKIMNSHPSLLPSFAGLMDLDVHRAVLNSSTRVSGCTVHLVTEEVDAGPILVQKKCTVRADDTAESLKTRVQQLEGSALVEAIAEWKPGH